MAASTNHGAPSSAVTVAAVANNSVPPAWGAKRKTPQCGSPPANQLTSLALCNFHKKFGDAARKCVQGCSRWGEHRRETPASRVFQVGGTLDGEDEQVGAALENE